MTALPFMHCVSVPHPQIRKDAAGGRLRVRCSQAANPSVKKEYFLTV